VAPDDVSDQHRGVIGVYRKVNLIGPMRQMMAIRHDLLTKALEGGKPAVREGGSAWKSRHRTFLPLRAILNSQPLAKKYWSWRAERPEGDAL
jgi:hypothetical protein